MKTIQNNQFVADEITSSGLTVVKASWIEAPMIAECFMNLERKYMWENEIVPAVDIALINLCQRGGIVVTQDYGVAALAQ